MTLDDTIALRKATAADAEFVHRVVDATIREYAVATFGVWKEEEARRRSLDNIDAGTTQVVECAGEAIGIQVVEREAGHIALQRLFILPAHQRRGIGTLLLRRLIAEARSAGMPLRLRVLRVNPARNLYLRMGFRVIDETPERFFMEHGGPIELTTARLRLRQWKPADREPYAALNADPEVMRYFPGLQSRETSDKAIDTWSAELAQRGWSNWAVALRDSDEFVGFTGLSVPRRALPFMPCVEVGWRLARAHWKKGYATEAAKAALAVGFGQLGLEEIVSFTALGNAPSRAVMERIGMTDSGEDFDHPALPVGHELRRHCLYRLKRERWLAIT